MTNYEIVLKYQRDDALKRIVELENENTQVCEWWADDDPDMWGDCGLWESTCGVAYQFTAGGPTENSHKYCHKCGKPISISEGGADERHPPCSVGCYNHVTHPCEKCGRLQGYRPKISEGGGDGR